MPRLLPRTIRWQLILGTAMLQCLLVAAVFGYVYHQERDSLRHRTAERLNTQVHVLATAAAPEMKGGHLSRLQSVLDAMSSTASIRAARITNLSGATLAYSSDQIGNTAYPPLSAAERRNLGSARSSAIFDDGNRGIMAVQQIEVEGTPVGLAWIYPDPSEDRIGLASILHSALLFALLAIAANALFSLLLAGSVTRPLLRLLRGTKLLIRDPERSGVFPLKTNFMNEAGELTRSFNTMVAALKEQRAGLNKTLALLDSMLANAPIGFAFFDRKMRYVRMNQYLAELDQISIAQHLGRTVQEIYPGTIGIELSAAIEHVFASGEPVHDLEIHGELPTQPPNPRIWLVSVYPVHTVGERSSKLRAGLPQANLDGASDSQLELLEALWVGAVISDVTERKLSEEVLRRTEKLAATGQLAASIAHEINNPLEAVMNLLYLLHEQPLDQESRRYADMAAQEISRVSQITQQTLRFYRQSSNPSFIKPADLLDSVLTLQQGRLNAAKIHPLWHHRGTVELFAFSGEIRQLFANLIGNALDAMPNGGRLVLSVRSSQAWNQRDVPGVRITVADTGCGMPEHVRRRIFEAFFTTKEITGTGLGLWISSEIVEKHHGTIRVRSREAEVVAGNSRTGTGTVFMLFFPYDGLTHSVVSRDRQYDFAAVSRATSVEMDESLDELSLE
ncbi:MAG: sensor histidine kinase [Acidobacteriaceae bacterium]